MPITKQLKRPSLLGQQISKDQLNSFLDELEVTEPTESDVLIDYINHKTSWAPNLITECSAHLEVQNQAMGTSEALLKCIALALKLELPVGAFTLTGAINLLSPLYKYVLKHNAADELIHYNQFDALAQAVKLPQEYLEEAELITNALLKYPAHPLFMSAFIELGIFFPSLSVMRKFGDSTIKTAVNYVSRDEAAHVRVGWDIIDTMRIPNASKQLAEMRRDIVAWMTSSIKVPRFNTDYWIANSDSLIETRKAEGFEFTSVGMVVAPFEMANNTLPSY